MLFRKDKQIAFVLPTRCGSTSTKHFLESVGFSQVKHPDLPIHHHIKYSEAVRVYPNLRGYKKYGVFRNPVERFVSTVDYLLTGKPFVSPEEFLDFFNKNPDHPLDIFRRPQVEWLDHDDIEVIQFEGLVEGVLSAVGGSSKDFPHLNSSSSAKTFSSQYYEIMGVDVSELNRQVEEFVRDYYAIDYKFSKSVLNVEY